MPIEIDLVAITERSKSLPISMKALGALQPLLEFHAIHLLKKATEIANRNGHPEITVRDMLQASDETTVART